MSRTRVFACIVFLFSLAVAFTVNERSKSAARTFDRPAIEHTSRNSTRLFPVGSQDQPSAAAPKLEGCISCHAQIEPMHKYGPAGALEKLDKEGKDGFRLSCTTCHGGNPVPRKTSDDHGEIERVKRAAHVQPRFPEEWKRNGK